MKNKILELYKKSPNASFKIEQIASMLEMKSNVDTNNEVKRALDELINKEQLYKLSDNSYSLHPAYKLLCF